jgi:hypothetical protein
MSARLAADDRIGKHGRRKDPVNEGATILSNVRNRHRVMAAGAILAVVTAVAGFFAVSAKADPTSLAVSDDNGRRVQRFYHPVHDQDSADPWYVETAVDTQQGFQPLTNRTYNSGIARITKVRGVVRVQVDAIRVGYGNFLLNDYYPSKFFDPRDNTPPGCADFAAGVLSLYADFSVAPGCQEVGNPLNSAADYEPDTSVVRGYSDWSPPIPCTDVTVATRGFFAIRWRNNDYSQRSLRTDPVDANPDCSP